MTRRAAGDDGLATIWTISAAVACLFMVASRVARDFLEPYPNGVGVEWPACSTTRAATSQEAPQRGTVAQ